MQIFILNQDNRVVETITSDSSSQKATYFFEDEYYMNLNNGAETFQFKTYTKDKNNLVVGNFVAFQYKDEYKLFQIIETIDEHDQEFTTTVYCEMAGIELVNSVVRPMTMTATSIKQFVVAILQDTEWKIGYVDDSIADVYDIKIEQPEKVYNILQECVYNTFGAEISFTVNIKNGYLTEKYVNIHSERGNFTGYRFSYEKNIEKVTRTVDTSDLATALVGVGNDGLTFKDVEANDKPKNQDFIANEDSFVQWNKNGNHIFGVVNFQTDSAQELLKLTREELKNRSLPKIKYELDVAYFGWENLGIGDTVYVIDNHFLPALHLSARINELRISFTDSTKNECVLSNFKEVYSNITDELRQIVDGFKTTVYSKEEIDYKNFQTESQVQKTASDITYNFMNSDDGHLNTGITKIDKDGVNVASSTTEVDTQISSEGMTVNEKGGTIASYTNQGAFTPSLEATEIYTNQIYINDGASDLRERPLYAESSKTIYVNLSSGNDSADGETVDTALRTIQEALDRTPYLLRDYTYTYNIRGTSGANQQILMRGFHGGYIVFDFQRGTKLYSNQIDITSSTTRLTIKGNRSAYGTIDTGCAQIIQTDSGSCLYVAGSYVMVSDIAFIGAGKGSGFAMCAAHGGQIYATNCETSRWKSSLRTETTGRIGCYGIIGSELSYFVTGSSCGLFQLPSTSSVHPNADAFGESGMYHTLGASALGVVTSGDIVKSSTTVVPEPTEQSYTKSYNANKIYSDETLNGWSDRDELIQGYASSWSTGRWTGYIKWSDDMSSIRSALSGATMTGGSIKITRQSTSGNATGSKLCLYGSDGTVITTTTTIDRGKSATVTLSQSVIDKIKAGTIKFFYLKADTSNTATYFKCTNTVTLTLSYKK